MDNSVGTIVAVLIIILIGVVGWLAYSQGYFKGAAEEDQIGLEINIGGSSDQPVNTSY